MSKNYNNKIQIQFKRGGLESNLSPFQRTVGSTESTLPKFHTDGSERKYLQSATAAVEEDDLYDPFAADEEEPEPEPVKPPPPKKKKRKS